MAVGMIAVEIKIALFDFEHLSRNLYCIHTLAFVWPDDVLASKATLWVAGFLGYTNFVKCIDLDLCFEGRSKCDLF